MIVCSRGYFSVSRYWWELNAMRFSAGCAYPVNCSRFFSFLGSRWIA